VDAYLPPNEKALFICDDIFGQYDLDAEKLTEWTEYFKSVMGNIAENRRFVFTTRSRPPASLLMSDPKIDVGVEGHIPMTVLIDENPGSHRNVVITADEAVELICLASRLIKTVELRAGNSKGETTI
jgi:hypothetical protein